MRVDDGNTTQVRAVIDRATGELKTLEREWKRFTKATESLSICQPELLGRPINMLTNAFEGFHAHLIGETSARSSNDGEYLDNTVSRAEIIAKLKDLYEERTGQMKEE